MEARARSSLTALRQATTVSLTGFTSSANLHGRLDQQKFGSIVLTNIGLLILPFTIAAVLLQEVAVASGMLLAAALALLLVQFRGCRRFAAAFSRRPQPVPGSPLPKAAVILSLRGADPSLRKCLKRLLAQDYPEYEVRIVLDSPSDPAAAVVEKVLEKNPGVTNVTVTVLRDRQVTCGLKSSAVLQTLEELDDSVEAVAIVDADVITYRHWLRDLLSPLNDPEIGAASGLRYYAPVVPQAGAIVRKLWNVSAVLQMHRFGVPWGGSLAIRRDVFRNAGVLQRWRGHPTEDTSLYDSLRELKLKGVFVPAATMVNCETVDLAGCFRFIRRQMLWLWLSHSAAGRIVSDAFVAAGMFWLPLLVAACAFAMGDTWSAGLALAGGTIFQVGQGAIVIGSSRLLRRVAEERGDSLQRFAFTPWILILALVTQVIYQAAVVSMLSLRRIEWRGISYSVTRAGRFRLIEYRPYSAADNGVSRRMSL